MIIIGYQGIGKSTLSKRLLKFIDLESSMWRVNGIRNETWYIEYCSVAEGLSKQGYTVFVSSHKEVRERLKNSSEQVYICFPSIELKLEWIKRLEARYEWSKLDKDYRALMNAKDRYDENILELKQSDFPAIELTSMQYDLQTSIDLIHPMVNL